MNINDSYLYVSTHPWMKKSFAKLKSKDIEIVKNFFNADYANKDVATLACNRMFMDCQDKPKNWKIINEICSCIITHYYGL